VNWLNEPPQWRDEDGVLTVTTEPASDFWRKTHYGFIRDSGHFLATVARGDFVADVKVVGQYETLYDQAGLMVRVDEVNWLKCGIEYVEGVQYASAVVTRDYSDWSVAPLPGSPAAFWLRLKREGTSLEIHYSLDGEDFELLRVTYLPMGEEVQVGPMCASPGEKGFTVRFEDFVVR
jgi:regulation of enolase protein 1 (concanavalin A-like superfamily)